MQLLRRAAWGVRGDGEGGTEGEGASRSMGEGASDTGRCVGAHKSRFVWLHHPRKLSLVTIWAEDRRCIQRMSTTSPMREANVVAWCAGMASSKVK